MKREAFMKELEYLLQDIPDEEREEAISYYRDYLEEAGSENEEKVIEEFGSPERVAAIIRADLSGNLKDGGSFTDTGYDDERFRDPNFQVAKRLDLPDEKESAAESGQEAQKQAQDGTCGEAVYGNGESQNGAYAGSYQNGTGRENGGYGGNGAYKDAGTYQNGAYQNGTYQGEAYQGAGGSRGSAYENGGQYREKYTRSKVRNPGEGRKPWTNGILKLVLWGILLIVASPFLLGAIAIAGGILVGAVTAVFGILFCTVCLTIAAFVGGIALGVLGLVMLASLSVLDSLLMIACSLMSIGAGLIGAAVIAWFFCIFLPFLWKGVKKLWGILFRRVKEAQVE